MSGGAATRPSSTSCQSADWPGAGLRQPARRRGSRPALARSGIASCASCFSRCAPVSATARRASCRQPGALQRFRPAPAGAADVGRGCAEQRRAQPAPEAVTGVLASLPARAPRAAWEAIGPRHREYLFRLRWSLYALDQARLPELMQSAIGQTASHRRQSHRSADRRRRAAGALREGESAWRSRTRSVIASCYRRCCGWRRCRSTTCRRSVAGAMTCCATTDS